MVREECCGRKGWKVGGQKGRMVRKKRVQSGKLEFDTRSVKRLCDVNVGKQGNLAH